MAVKKIKNIPSLPELLTLCLLILLASERCDAYDANCDFYQKIETGKTYYITNPNYPRKYGKNASCRWRAASESRIRITCDKFDIPGSTDCMSDTFNVYTDNDLGPRRYCGAGNFTNESQGNEIIVTLVSSSTSTGGIFNCHFRAIEESECRCGWKMPTKIVGGIETGVNEYPMMAGIVDALIKQVFCGGTIISNRHIITAAHCISHREVENLGVLIGDHDLSTNTETNATKLYRVASVVKHPSYSEKHRDYDIAVITIAGFIEFTNEIGPACLPFQHHLDSFGGSFVDVLGWGTTEFGGKMSSTLKMVQLSVLNFLTCKKYYQELEYRQFCTYADGRDSCQFDSGGPILWQNPTSRRLVHVGIISFGKSCASFLPGVNVRVGSFIDWIVEVTPGANYCQIE